MSLEIVVIPPSPSAVQAPALTARSARELLDVFVGGDSATVPPRGRRSAFVLRDLALALVELARRPRGKATVRFYDEPWEMCVERFGHTACLSVYRTGPDPLMAVHDRAVPMDEVVAAVRDAIERHVADAATSAQSRVELSSAVELLRAISMGGSAFDDTRIPELVPVLIEPEGDTPLSFGAEFSMREGIGSHGCGDTSGSSEEPGIEHTDLHALLFRGRVRAEIRGRVLDLGECHPLLVAEQLVELARRGFDAWERGLRLNARGEIAGVFVGVRVSTDGELSLTLGISARKTVHTFPALGVAHFLEAALAFGRSLVRAILRRDRAQSFNLRLSALRRTLREASDALREANQTDGKVNPTPEPYRAYAAALDHARRAPSPSVPSARLRYAPRWRAIVPGIDLRGTYLCGDRLVVCATSEMWALDRVDGRVLWRTEIARGTSVVAPGGIARLAHDGGLFVHDLASGKVTLRAHVAPRVGGPVAGAVVHLPGLPKLAIVTEGEHHLVAVDLNTGEPRWRWSWGGGRSRTGGPRRAPRLKRAGRLLYFTCGDGALTALDVMTGAVVWRVRDRLRFRLPPTISHDALFVVAGGAHGAARLYRIDPYSGHVRWSKLLVNVGGASSAPAPCTIEGSPLVADGAVAVAVRTARHAGEVFLAAFQSRDGTRVERTASAPVFSPSGTSWLAIDDTFIGNAPTGDLVSTDASGALRWRHVRAQRPLEVDVPRRLEPVLRGGALFVPHADITMLRPADGAVLGTIAGAQAGAIPDLLRVDERGDVYFAEESGHLVAFGALPRLRLV